MTPLIEARGISMTFPGVRALADVDFDVYPGEVHALTGENGAGKSTFIRILSGEIGGYEGDLVLDGRTTRLASPADAIEAGIAVIPQELLLVSSLSAADNILLGREPTNRFGWIDRRALASTAGRHLAALGETASSSGPVGRLEAGRRQLVAIARALSLKARLIIMDEPTTSLGPHEVRRLEGIVKELAGRGVAIVYISHRLDEIRRLADRVTVLRDGRRVATTRGAAISDRDLLGLMVGRDIESRALPPLNERAPDLLRVENAGGVSLTVRRGEIVGLAGLVGAGRSEFLLALAGASDRRLGGRIWLDGCAYAPSDPSAARRAGIVILPEDRQSQGLFPQLPVLDNVTIGALDRVEGRLFIDRAKERRAGDAVINRTGVRAANTLAPVSTLSGGNQQKVLLARCLFAAPTVLLLDEPTRGVDLAAKAEIARAIFDLASRGFGIVLSSSDMTEILTMAHRIVVFREGGVAATFTHGEATEERVLTAAAGASSPAPDHGADDQPPPSGTPPAGQSSRRWPRITSLLALAAVILLALVSSPVRSGRLVFLDVGNLTDILRQVAEKGILAAGMTPVIISGGIDLSVGSVLALAATVSGLLLMHLHAGAAATIAAALLVGALAGVVNGGIAARWRVQPFIVTLATMSAARGVARYLSGGAAIPLGFGAGGAPASFRVLGGALVPNVPVPAVLFLASVALVFVLLARTRAGRYVYAIGDNEAAARLCGVPVATCKALVYVLCGALAGLAGVVHCAQLEQGNPNDGVAYELDAIAAVVIGGTSLSGGVGTVGGTLVGTLIIGVINNSLGLNNIDANAQLILKGAIILGAVWLQRHRG
jgi:ABC-type sugar transport system ATPase subunit/ribose/xylose/arabinose/galactoside ABC-type transport system permease subunit